MFRAELYSALTPETVFRVVCKLVELALPAKPGLWLSCLTATLVSRPRVQQWLTMMKNGR